MPVPVVQIRVVHRGLHRTPGLADVRAALIFALHLFLAFILPALLAASGLVLLLQHPLSWLPHPATPATPPTPTLHATHATHHPYPLARNIERLYDTYLDSLLTASFVLHSPHQQHRLISARAHEDGEQGGSIAPLYNNSLPDITFEAVSRICGTVQGVYRDLAEDEERRRRRDKLDLLSKFDEVLSMPADLAEACTAAKKGLWMLGRARDRFDKLRHELLPREADLDYLVAMLYDCYLPRDEDEDDSWPQHIGPPPATTAEWATATSSSVRPPPAATTWQGPPQWARPFVHEPELTGQKHWSLWAVNTTLQILFAGVHRYDDDPVSVPGRRLLAVAPLLRHHLEESVSAVARLAVLVETWLSAAELTERYVAAAAGDDGGWLSSLRRRWRADPTLPPLNAELSVVDTALRLLRAYLGHMRDSQAKLQRAEDDVAGAVHQWDATRRELEELLRSGLVAVETATASDTTTQWGRPTPVVRVTESKTVYTVDSPQAVSRALASVLVKFHDVHGQLSRYRICLGAENEMVLRACREEFRGLF